MNDNTNLPAPIDSGRGLLSTVEQLADIPEEEIWLQKQKSARTQRAYRLDVQNFMSTLGITTPAGFPQADHKAVIAWEQLMRETEGAAPSTIRQRLAALSSLYKHLVRHGHAARNPVGESSGRRSIAMKEPPSPSQRRRRANCSDALREDTIAGLRDRAMLTVGLQVGLRRAEIASLTVGDLHQNHGYDALRVTRKRGRRDALAINPQTAARIRPYLERAGHAADVGGPLFRPLKHNGKQREERRRVDPDAIDRAWSGNMPPSWASIAATRRIRCGQPSSPARSRTAPSSKTCRKLPDTATPVRRSSMTGAGTIPKRPRAFLRHIKKIRQRR